MTATVTPKGHGLGYIYDTRQPPVIFRASEPAPYEFVDLEADPATPPVWDQGQLGSCTAHGTLAAFLFAAVKCGVVDPMLSRLELYYSTRAIEGTTGQDAGGMIHDAIRAAATGLAPEEMWPYDISKFTEQPPSDVMAASVDNRAITYEAVGNDRHSIQVVLSQGLPVVIGVQLDPDSFESQEALSTGIVPLPTGSPQDGHCMAVFGIGLGQDWHDKGQFLAADAGTLYAKLRNSWGTAVYQRGYLLVPITYLEKFGDDYWTIRTVS